MTPHSSPQTPTRPVHQCLSFSSNGYQDPDSTPVYSDSSDEEEEDFQMVALDDEHWTSEEVPENFLHTRKWITTQLMPISMSLWEQ